MDRGRIARGVGSAIGALAALTLFALVANFHYPLKQWAFFVYLKLWGWVALFALAVLSSGTLVVRRLAPPSLPLRERLVYSLAAGVLVFFYGAFLGGITHVLRPWFAVALPLVLIAAGAPGLVRDARRLARHVRARRRRGVTPRSAWRTPAIVFGSVGTLLVYWAILSPRNVAFDATFYHLGIAQQYATEHAITPFQEGWMPGALPHLASVLYAWAFVLPGLDMFGRIVCAAHVEFVIFLFTLASIPVLVRWLAPRADASASWVAVFLFPGVLVYDSSLTTAADHIAAFWAVPAWLAFRRAYQRFDRRAMIVLALCLAGAMLTKYQAMYIVAFPVLALLGRAAFGLGRGALKTLKKASDAPTRAELAAPALGLATAAGAGLAFTAPHWLKNWVFYGNPLFPYMSGVFKPTRWVPDTPRLFEEWSSSQTQKWVTQGSFGTKLLEAGKAMFTFSFIPHDWPNFHGRVPIFGSLFTLSLALLPFLKGARRTWALVAATHLGVFVWFWTMHQDRYLQALLPWMAAVVAATIALAFKAELPQKLAVGALVALQIVWGLDAYLLPAHAMTKASPLYTTADLIALGQKKRYDDRWKVAGTLFEIGASKELPPNAKVLLHENNPRLGLWRPLIADVAGWQFGLRYELMASPAEMDRRLRALGVTHIVSRAKTARGMDGLGADLRFFDYINQDAKVLRRWGDMTLYALPETAPPEHDEAGDLVAYFGCGKLYQRGLHKLAALHVRDKQVLKPPPQRKAEKRASNEPAALLAEASFAVIDPKCKPAIPASELTDFIKVGQRNKEELWARKRAAEAASHDDGGSGAPDDDDRMFDLDEPSE